VSTGAGARTMLQYPRTQSPPHGFSDDGPTRRLLRSRPPRAALAWAEGVLGGTVLTAHALRGGTSSAVHMLEIRSTGGGLGQVVMRRYVRPELNLEEPDIVKHEVDALCVAATADVPTPRLLAADLRGEDAGVPAILMSRLPGRVDWSPKNLDRWLTRLAELLPRIHAARPGPGRLPSFVPYAQDSYEPPGWAHRPKVWERAVEILHGPAPRLNEVFIQRDFHPGNVLWDRGAVSGVVDWQAACTGPAVADVAHCRSNLFRYGLGAADRFTEMWESHSGQTYHPWAEVVGVMGLLDCLRDDYGSDRFVSEEALTRAVAALGNTA
jgi:aminoglycoside phosphotransferase (APT) family kinase protein